VSYTLRPYQREAVDALFRYFETHDGNPILALPTASGKSLIQAAFIQETLERWPGERFLLVSHVKEILQQDADKIQALMPSVTVGIYSAGLGKKETGYQVTIAGIQSAYQHAHEMGEVSIVIIDECHLCNRAKDSMYHKFLDTLRRFCPHLKIIGLSATPYRLDSGPLTKGSNRIFTDIAHRVSILDLIAQGYLAPVVSAGTRCRADTSGVAKRGGEYVAGDLEKYMNREALTDAALSETETFCGDRKSWVVFCCGVDHARDVAQALRMRGHAAEIVVGTTPKDVRADRLDRFKRRELKIIVSVGVITTGFDAPCIDALICLRPTLSPGLWVQMIGRAMRPYEGKEDALVLDFTNNTHVHGPVDLIDIDGNGEVKTSPYRVCPECGKLIPPREKACECGYSFQRECYKCHALFDRSLAACPDCGAFVRKPRRKVAHEETAGGGELLSNGDNTPYEIDVEGIDVVRHQKEGKPDSVKVSFYENGTLGNTYHDWLCFDHSGFAMEKARAKWVALGGLSPAPLRTDRALDRRAELRAPEKVRVKREGKYWRLIY